MLSPIIMHMARRGEGIDYRITARLVYSCTNSKASVGMYSGRDYLYKSCLCTFWPSHPYFIL